MLMILTKEEIRAETYILIYRFEAYIRIYCFNSGNNNVRIGSSPDAIYNSNIRYNVWIVE